MAKSSRAIDEHWLAQLQASADDPLSWRECACCGGRYHPRAPPWIAHHEPRQARQTALREAEVFIKAIDFGRSCICTRESVRNANDLRALTKPAMSDFGGGADMAGNGGQFRF
jgi:hypothetical protein